jgi:ribosomal protein S18 acetylase RimI-like enzyme
LIMPKVTIRPFEPHDQQAARTLILDGLGGHFGFIDESRNPDLDDIMAHYVDLGNVFVVAQVDGSLVGTGALIAEGQHTGRIVRMSVRRDARRQGIGQLLVAYLLSRARERGYTRVLVETNNDWDDAIALYRRCGFVEYDRDDVSVYLALTLHEGRIIPG